MCHEYVTYSGIGHEYVTYAGIGHEYVTYSGIGHLLVTQVTKMSLICDQWIMESWLAIT